MSGKKKKTTKVFYIGKNIRSDSRLTPIKGEPNTNLDIYGKSDGKLRTRKKYGKDGFAIRDLDVGHYNHNKGDHAHDYHGVFRSEKRSLSKKEKSELKKAKRKRRFW